VKPNPSTNLKRASLCGKQISQAFAAFLGDSPRLLLGVAFAQQNRTILLLLGVHGSRCGAKNTLSPRIWNRIKSPVGKNPDYP
jgi:hypothetical protein